VTTVELFHYTRAVNVTLIYATGLRPSIRVEGDPSSDAQHGDGQYFTDLHPQEAEQFKRPQVSQALFRTPRKWGITGTLSPIAWIKFSLELEEVQSVHNLFASRVREAHPIRGIWLFPNASALPARFIVEDGIVNFKPMKSGSR
jgi:hypothetical protein